MPDQTALDSPGSPAVLNVAPGDKPGTYRSFPRLVEYTQAMPSRVLGAAGVRSPDGTTYTYAATNSEIRLLTGLSWTDKSKVGGYNLTNEEQWEILQYDDKVIFTCLTDPVQVDAVAGTGFTDMITSTRKPKARRIGLVNRDWIFLGNCTDSVDGDRPNRVWWSARGDETDFDPDVVTQCGFEDIDAEDGPVQKIVSGEFATVIGRRGIWRFTYQGGDVIYRADRVLRNRGAVSGGAVVDIGRVTFFWDEDGFYRFDGVSETPIGESRWNKLFWNEVDSANLEWITASVDYQRSLVAFAYPRAGTVPDRVFLYNWKTDRAAIADVQVSKLFLGFTPSLFTDDAAVSSLMIDDYPQSEWNIDSSEFIGRLQSFSAFKPDNKMWTFNGPAMDATLTTLEKAVNRGAQRTQVTGVRPLIDGNATVTVQIGTREIQSTDSITWGVDTPTNLVGVAPILTQGRYMRARVKTSGDFNHAIGVEVDAIPLGVF